jgi:hypothetical protein
MATLMLLVFRRSSPPENVMPMIDVYASPGRDEIDRIAGVIKATHPDFRYEPIAEPEESGNGGRIRWVSGRPYAFRDRSGRVQFGRRHHIAVMQPDELLYKCRRRLYLTRPILQMGF